MLTELTALLAGTVHVLSGPDHLASVAPLAMTSGRRGWFAGWTWGLGHTTGVVVVACVAVLMRDLLPPITVISAWSERLVGGALVGIGLWALRKGSHIGTGAHTHDDLAHAHMYVRRGPACLRRLGHAHAAFLMGVLHGLAGSSHFLGVLPALALPTRAAAFTYIALFGAATIVTMTGFAAAISAAAGRAGSHGRSAHRALIFAGAAAAIVVGGAWLTR